MDFGEKTASFWWRERIGADLHESLFSYVEHLRDIASGERSKDAVHALLYHNDQAFSGPYATALRALTTQGYSSVKLNISKNIVDTLTAKIGKNHPAIKAATDGASWSSRLKGRRLGKFLNAKLEETKFRRIAPLIFRDACIRGTGIVKISSENGELLPERVLKENILIDPIEARYGKPRQMHQVYTIAREVVAEMFPEKLSQIREASSAAEQDVDYTDFWTDSRNSNKNMLRVVESWHLPSGPDATDGRHAICIEGATLFHGSWERDRFPFAFIYWSAPDKGFWGNGLVEELAAIQWEIDNTIQAIGESLHIGGKLKVFISRGSKIVKTQLNNKIGAIVEYTGSPPTFSTPNPVSEQMFRYLEYLYNKASELSGVSQLSSQSKVPARVGDSAPAIQTLYDIETERFAHQALAYRNLYLDVAEAFIDIAKELYEDNPEYSGKWVDRNLVEKIRWNDVDMKEDQFKLKLEALNLFPDTRAGKLAALKELTSIGILPQQLIGSAIQSPDLEKIYSTINAAHNNIEWVIGRLEDTDADMPEPEPFQDLQLGINLVKAAYNDNQASGAPEEVQERFQEWINNAAAVLKLSKAPQGPQTAPGAPQKGITNANQNITAAAPMPAPSLPAPPLPPTEAPPVPVADEEPPATPPIASTES